jgi:hypothetical protein
VNNYSANTDGTAAALAAAHAAGVAEERGRWEALVQEHITNIKQNEDGFRAEGDHLHRRMCHQMAAALKYLRECACNAATPATESA